MVHKSSEDEPGSWIEPPILLTSGLGWSRIEEMNRELGQNQEWSGEWMIAFVWPTHFSWFDRFQGVLSLGGGTISDPSGYSGLFTVDRLYSEVGAGLRIHMLSLGVQQWVMALDFAYPLTPLDRKYEVQQDDETYYVFRDPFKIKFGIMQTF